MFKSNLPDTQMSYRHPSEHCGVHMTRTVSLIMSFLFLPNVIITLIKLIVRADRPGCSVSLSFGPIGLYLPLPHVATLLINRSNINCEQNNKPIGHRCKLFKYYFVYLNLLHKYQTNGLCHAQMHV